MKAATNPWVAHLWVSGKLMDAVVAICNIQNSKLIKGTKHYNYAQLSEFKNLIYFS